MLALLRGCRFAHLLAAAALILGANASCRAAGPAPDRTTPGLPGLRPESLPDAPGEIPAPKASLPERPQLAFASPSTSLVPFEPRAAVQPAGTPAFGMTQHEIDRGCQAGTLHGKPCRLNWAPALWEAFEATAMENVGNIALDTETRHDVATRPYWSTYVKCVKQYRFGQWSDDTPFIVHDIGHPMQGAIVYSIYEQNDPKIRGRRIQSDGLFWREHLKAMAFVTVYEIQWKLGPASEAAIGNSGLNTYYTPSVVGRTTNETGFQDFFITPVYGLGWNVTEELVDRYLMPHVWRHTHNKFALTAYAVLTPCKAAANILRFKPFYYRDFDLPPVHSAATAP